jgi:streptogramin lyase
MEHLINTAYNYFHVKNYTGNYSLSSYSLEITPFTFIPHGLTDTGNNFSNKKLLWEFGDGTTSTSITASHYYRLPGTYTVTLNLIDKLGAGVIDSYKKIVTVTDYIPDTFVLTNTGSYGIYPSYKDNYFTIHRFNNAASYQEDKEYTFNLFASGCNAPLLNLEQYEKSAYDHLLPYTGFFTKTYNCVRGIDEYIPVDKVNTTNELLYFKLSGINLVKCLETDKGACFAGTSGRVDVYYTDDLISNIGNNTLIFVSIDGKHFTDYSNLLLDTPYQVIQQIPQTIFYTICASPYSSALDITSNGINTFDIDKNQFVDTKIPFVVKILDENNVDKKHKHVLIHDNTLSEANTVKIEVLSGAGYSVGGVNIYADFGTLTARSLSGGYFKGYLQFNQPCNDVYIKATISTSASAGEFYGWLAQPDSDSLHLIEIDSTTGLTTTNTTVSSYGLSGISSLATVVNSTILGNVWLTDADNDKIIKLTPAGLKTVELSLSAMTLSNNNVVSLLGNLSSAAPSHICIDSNEDVWVTLFDAVSTIKINALTNKVTAVAYPPLTNIALTATETYATLSGYAGDNSLTPSCVDTDIADNIWVSYSNPISSYLVKYDTNGTVLSTIPLTAGYSADSLLVDPSNNVWVIYKDCKTTATILSTFNDNILHINSATAAVTTIAISGSIGYITIDTNENIWISHNKLNLIGIDSTSFTLTTYQVPLTSNSTNYLSDIGAIGGTFNGKIYVGDDTNKTLYVVTPSAINPYEEAVLDTISDPNDMQMLLGYGDWTGLRYILKYDPTYSTVATTTSDTFTVYPLSGGYQFSKINEYVDFTDMYKSFIFQENILDKPILFDNFIGTIVGNKHSSPNTLGKRVNEKIANFVDNTYNAYTCNINNLASIYQEFGQELVQFDKFKFAYPSNIARLVDIFSIKQTKLWGSNNIFSENFDRRGTIDNDVFGINIGNKLDIYTTILTAGSASMPIVALEKFSNKYKLLNTDILSGNYTEYKNEALQTYALSTFSIRWGWNLVLPDAFTIDQIDETYSFYEYIHQPENSQLEGTIDWEHTTWSQTLSSKTDWKTIAENMLTCQLFKGLQLFTSATVID